MHPSKGRQESAHPTVDRAHQLLLPPPRRRAEPGAPPPHEMAPKSGAADSESAFQALCCALCHKLSNSDRAKWPKSHPVPVSPSFVCRSRPRLSRPAPFGLLKDRLCIAAEAACRPAADQPTCRQLWRFLHHCHLQAAVQSEFWRVQRRQLAVSSTGSTLVLRSIATWGRRACGVSSRSLLQQCCACSVPMPQPPSPFIHCRYRPVLQCLPDVVANELLHRLLQQRRVSPPQLELFQYCVTRVELAGGSITGPWLAYLAGFPSLQVLHLRSCTKLRDKHAQHLAALAPSLQELDLAGCSGLGDDTAAALLCLTSLNSLDLSATSLGPGSIRSLCSALTGLTHLSLADLLADDACCDAMGARLPSLASLNLAGTAVGDAGMVHLEQLRSLTALDLSHTQVWALSKGWGVRCWFEVILVLQQPAHQY